MKITGIELTEKDMQRLNPSGIQSIINSNNALINTWSVSKQDKTRLENENKELKDLLRRLKNEH